MNKNTMIAILVVAVVVFGGLYMYNKGQSEATFGEKAGNTVSQTADKVADDVKDATN